MVIAAAVDEAEDSAGVDVERQEDGVDSAVTEAGAVQEAEAGVASLAAVASPEVVAVALAAEEEVRPEVGDTRCTTRSMMHWRWRLAYKSGMAAVRALRRALPVRYFNAVGSV